VWNQELANIAYSWASRCNRQGPHNPNRKYRNSMFGENMAGGTNNGADKNMRQAVQMWFDEHKVYRYPGGFRMKTGHYTQVTVKPWKPLLGFMSISTVFVRENKPLQVVWAKTREVGCGGSICGGNYVIICDYFPPWVLIQEANHACWFTWIILLFRGNYNGQLPYQKSRLAWRLLFV